MSIQESMWQEIRKAALAQTEAVLKEFEATPATERPAYKAAYNGTLAALRNAGMIPTPPKALPAAEA